MEGNREQIERVAPQNISVAVFFEIDITLDVKNIFARLTLSLLLKHIDFHLISTGFCGKTNLSKLTRREQSTGNREERYVSCSSLFPLLWRI